MTPRRFSETLGLEVLASPGFNRQSFGKCSTQHPRQYLSMGRSCGVDGLALVGTLTGGRCWRCGQSRAQCGPPHS